MICPNPTCQKQVPEEEKFCPFCGMLTSKTPLESETSPPEQVAQVEKLDSEASTKICNCGHENPLDSQFCEGCGKSIEIKAATPPSQKIMNAIIIFPNGHEEQITTTRWIGREDLLDIVPSEKSDEISRKHCKIVIEDDNYFLEDEPSPEREGRTSGNKTYLNDIEITNKGRQQLKDGDTIDLAELVKLQFKIR